MAMKSVGLFVDLTNLYYCCGKRWVGRKLDYKKFYDKVKEITGNDMYRAFAYGAAIDRKADKFIVALRYCGFDVKYKEPKIYTKDNKEIREAKEKTDGTPTT